MNGGIRIQPVGEAGTDGEAWAAIRNRIGYPVPDAEPPTEARSLLAWRGKEAVARLAMGVSEGLIGAPGRTGWVGWYEAVDAEAGSALLRRARERLAGEAVERVIGPFHGSSWDRYRLALREPGSAEAPPFLSEPWNPFDYPAHFAAAGFGSIARYESRLSPPAGPEGGERAVEARARLAEAGIFVRALDPDRFEAELRRIHSLSVAAFAANRFYSPVGWERFRAMYLPMLSLLDPSLVLLAESPSAELLGFCFAFPDPLAPPDRPRVIVKSLAAAPAARGAGLGGGLVSLVHAAPAARGAAIVHALMEADNPSQRISARHLGAPFRRYALFGAPAR